MTALRRTVREAVVICVIGFVLAMVCNAVRASGSLKWTKDYFAVYGPSPDDPARVDAPGAPERNSTSPHAASPSSGGEHLDQLMTFDEVVKVFNDPKRESGLYVFVDARSATVFEDGHIPGAIQADHYNLDECVENLLDHVSGAEKIIVYCNGGDCEDSKFLCGDLHECDVPCEAIYAYYGGWEEWQHAGMPVETGGHK